MNFRTFVILMNIFFMIPSIHGNELKIETAKRVLDKLYQANGNLIFIKPGIRISDKEFAVAQYLSGENVIILERKLLQLCYEFGTDSMNALAFVLGHELMHCSSIQSKTKNYKTNFLARSHEHTTPDEDERMADVQGLFSCWLADFNASAILPDLLTKIYSSYGLEQKLKGYPSLNDRMKTSYELIDQVKLMIQLFENASYLIAAEEYQLARNSFLYLETFYQSYEIYNNIGFSYLLEALELQDKETNFIYPIVIDPTSRLSKLNTARGAQDAAVAAKRLDYLVKAQMYFNKALRLNYNYFTAELNLMCVLDLIGNSKEVITKFKETELAKRKLMGLISGFEFNQGRAVLALAYLKSNQSTEGMALLDKIIRFSADSMLVRQARCNKDLQLQKFCSIQVSKLDPQLINSKRLVDGVKLHRQTYIGNQIKLIDQYEVSIKSLPESTIYVYSKNKQVQFVLQRVEKGSFYNKSVKLNVGNAIVRAKSNSICNYKDNKLILLVNNESNRVKVVVYYNSFGG